MPNHSIVRPESRTDHIMVLHSSNIYVFGGYNGLSRFNNMFRYELKTKMWCKIDAQGTLPSGRFGHSGAVHEASGRMIIFGGWDGRDTLDDLHQYDFDRNVWSTIESTGRSPPHRYRHTAVIYGDSMFVFGGVDKAHSRFNDLQRLDLSTWNVYRCITTIVLKLRINRE
jgi:N-acetylneuraminic acid mutarotase